MAAGFLLLAGYLLTKFVFYLSPIKKNYDYLPNLLHYTQELESGDKLKAPF